MKVSKEVLNEWKELKEYGDIANICALVPCSKSPIYNIFRFGEGQPRYIAAVEKFYNKRKKFVKQLNAEG